jgi:hypothetical protein
MLPQVVESRLKACAIFATDGSLGAESPEGTLQKTDGYPGTKFGNKEWYVATLRLSCLFPLLCVLSHRVIQFTSQGHEPGLVELRVPNHEYCLLQVHILQIQGKGLADP